MLSMLLPWYRKTYGAVVDGSLQQVTDSVNAFGAFSFVEAAVLLVSVALLLLLFARGERRGFQLPGGDGTAVLLAGAWTTILIVIRMFDKPSPASSEQGTTIGIDWGIFVALVTTAVVTYLGVRMREAERLERALANEPAPTVIRPTTPTGLTRRGAARPEAKPVQEELFPPED